jgi:hypothetical protein
MPWRARVTPCPNLLAQITKMQVGSAVFVGPKTQLLATWGRDLKVDRDFKESSQLNLRLLQLFRAS